MILWDTTLFVFGYLAHPPEWKCISLRLCSQVMGTYQHGFPTLKTVDSGRCGSEIDERTYHGVVGGVVILIL